MHFPTWRYHYTKPACIVADPEAEAALGPGWHDSPVTAQAAGDAAVAVADAKAAKIAKPADKKPADLDSK